MYDPEKHHRRSLRLKDYDYSQAGAYFVTLCTHERECSLGEIIDSEVKLSPVGNIVKKEWKKLSTRFSNVQWDAFVVMPNHIHGIIIFKSKDNVGATLVVAQTPRAGTSPAPTVGDVIGMFKSLCVNQCIQNELKLGKLWQRNYYEHIIRNEKALYRIRQYIKNNPLEHSYKNIL